MHQWDLSVLLKKLEEISVREQKLAYKGEFNTQEE